KSLASAALLSSVRCDCQVAGVALVMLDSVISGNTSDMLQSMAAAADAAGSNGRRAAGLCPEPAFTRTVAACVSGACCRNGRKRAGISTGAGGEQLSPPRSVTRNGVGAGTLPSGSAASVQP